MTLKQGANPMTNLAAAVELKAKLAEMQKASHTALLMKDDRQQELACLPPEQWRIIDLGLSQVRLRLETILVELGSGAGEPVYVPHKFWGAGEADCPKDIKSSNGELHTLRCKVCGKDNNKEPCSVTRPPVAGLAELTDVKLVALYSELRHTSKEFCGLPHPMENWAEAHDAAIAKAVRQFLGKVDG